MLRRMCLGGCVDIHKTAAQRALFRATWYVAPTSSLVKVQGCFGGVVFLVFMAGHQTKSMRMRPPCWAPPRVSASMGRARYGRACAQLVGIRGATVGDYGAFWQIGALFALA